MRKSLDLESWHKAGQSLDLQDGEQASATGEAEVLGRRPAPGRQTLWSGQAPSPELVPGVAVPGKRVLSQQATR